MTEAKTKQTDTKKILKIVLNVLLWIFLVFAFVMMVFAFASAANDYGIPVLGNKVILTVASDSMSPVFKKGDLLVGTVLTDEEKMALKEGDIVTYFVDLDGDGIKELNTHRIIAITAEDRLVTKGDNNAVSPVADAYQPAREEVVSLWKEGDTKVKGLGSVFAFLQSRVGFLCIIVVPLAVFFVYEVIRFAIAIVKAKRGDKKLITAADEEEIGRKAVEEYLRRQNEEAGNDPADSDESK